MALGVSLLLPAVPALAHNSLTGSNPADGARVASAPARIELRFLSKPDPATTKITVVGPGSEPAAGGAPSFTGSRVSVPFAAGPAGEYTIGYQLASSDGHPVKGTVKFTLTTGASAAPSAGGTPTASTPPVTTAPATSAPATVDPTAAADTDDDGAPVWPWLLGAGVLIAAGAALLLRRRAPRP
ncbi:copper resistance CopC family protein [Micromonospora coxensis]|uniref:copper resistance CopC family protein n=1 Tax=Micromonospora coxensis TaxID=356852 RepID=UPI00342A089D